MGFAVASALIAVQRQLRAGVRRQGAGDLRGTPRL